jgi:predicted RNA methylase
MTQTATTLSVKNSTLTILNCTDDFAAMKQSVDTLYEIFSCITGISPAQIDVDKDIMLPSGKAISPSAAAHCLLEMKRTAVFLRGIHKAILQKISNNAGKPICILYAGTGPYGTLIVPLLPLFTSKEIQVDLLDINPTSLDALKKLIDELQLNDYIGSACCEDATTFTLSRNYDIAISETMLACLKNEPQVAVMQNIIPQLQPEAIFIPEEIGINAALTNPKMEQDRLLYYEDEPPPFRRIGLGNVFTVNKQNLDTDRMQKTIEIPDEKDFPVLKLFTTVKVFGEELLSENDSSITLPVSFYDLRKQPALHIAFWYVQGEKPCIESKIPEDNCHKQYISSLQTQ